MSTPALAEWVAEVRADFVSHRAAYLAEIQCRLEDTDTVTDVELIGSYASGDARDESDVDLLVSFAGSSTEDEIFEQLAGRIVGLAGVFDIIPKKVG